MAMSAVHGDGGQRLSAMDNRSLVRAVRSELKFHFESPDLVAIFRTGEEGHFRKMAEAAWIATREVSARVFYVPNIAGDQVIFSMGGPILHSAHTESYDLGLADLISKTRYKSAAVIPLGTKEEKLGSIVLAWQPSRELIVRHMDGRIERRQKALKELDPFVHLEFLAWIGRDLTRVFLMNPLYLANYLL